MEGLLCYEGYFNWTTDIFEICIISPEGKEKVKRKRLFTFKEIDADKDMVRYCAADTYWFKDEIYEPVDHKDHIQIFHQWTEKALFRDDQYMIQFGKNDEGDQNFGEFNGPWIHWGEKGIWGISSEILEEYRSEYLNKEN